MSCIPNKSRRALNAGDFMLKFVEAWVIVYDGFASGLFATQLQALEHVVCMIKDFPDSPTWRNYKIEKLHGLVVVE